VVGYSSGEGVYERYDGLIAKVIKTFDKEGTIDRRPLALKLERDRAPRSALSFPGKVLADAGSNQLFIADSNHNRIVVLSLDDYSVKAVIGSGKAGLTDGDFERTRFNHPQGMAFDGEMLYVADTLKSNRVAPYAGSGQEGRIDGPLGAAALAQPSGITTDGERLYFADSEVSAVRSADLNPLGRVRTLAGGELFTFGDLDGRGLSVRLQHPLGVVHHDGSLYVADTYNNKIKRISVAQRTAETFLGTGKAGFEDGNHPAFDEPAGVSIANGTLYIADTNNHVIRVADLKTRRVETLQLKNAERLWPETGSDSAEQARVLPEQTVKPGKATLTIALDLPRGHKVSPDAPSFVTVTSSDGGTLALGAKGEQTFKMPRFPVVVPLRASEGRDSVRIRCAIYYCTKRNEGLCYFDGADIVLPVVARNDADGRDLQVPLKLTLP
jgi:DNA-binding beta-propeller fold protein YncE